MATPELSPPLVVSTDGISLSCTAGWRSKDRIEVGDPLPLSYIDERDEPVGLVLAVLVRLGVGGSTVEVARGACEAVRAKRGTQSTLCWRLGDARVRGEVAEDDVADEDVGEPPSLDILRSGGCLYVLYAVA